MMVSVLTRLAFEPAWQMSLLLRALRAELPGESEPVLAFAPRLKTADCKKVREDFAEDAETRRKGGLVLSPLRAKALGDACRGKLDVAGSVFVVVPGHAGDAVTLAYQAPGKAWEARRLEATLDSGQHRYWFSLVPAQSRVVVVHDDATTAATELYDESLGADYIVPASRDENARYCVQVEGLGDAALVLLDGRSIPVGQRIRRDGGTSTQYFAARGLVRKSEHQLVILHETGQVRAEVQIRPEDLSEDGCYVRRFDMTNRTASTLLVSVEPGCGSMGILQPRVYAFAKQYLQSVLSGRSDGSPGAETINDMEPWAAAFSAIARLNEALSPLGTRQVGGARANLDTRYVMQGLAGELLRKGFNRAYVATLSCSGVSGDPSFTFVVHRLDLERALSTKWEDAIAAKADDEGIATEQETVTHLNDLRDAVRAPLARLLQQPYARIVTRGEPSRVMHDPSQVVELWRPPGKSATAELRVLQSNQPSFDQAHCTEVSRERRLISAGALPGKLWNDPDRVDTVQSKTLELSAAERGSGPEERRISLEMDSAGLYVVELRMPDQDSTWRALTRDCITVAGDETRPRYAAQVTISPSVSSSDALLGDGVSSQVLLNASAGAWSFGPRLAWTLPVVLGYSTVARNAQTPPSWNDLGHGAVFDESGRLPLSWTRRSVLLGFRSDTEWRAICSIGDWWHGRGKPSACRDLAERVKLFARFSLLLDAGMIWASRVPRSLIDFYDSQPTDTSLLDIDVSTAIQLGATVRIGSRMDVGLGAQLGWLGFDDFLGVEERSIRYDSLRTFGVVVEMGYHP